MLISTVKTETFVMPYAKFGKGRRTLVILPGVSLHPVIQSAGAVERMFEEYGDEYTFYLFDRKEKIQSGYSVADMARDTAAAMRHLGLRKADVYGASQGGMMAQVLAAENPRLVRKLVLASTLAEPNAVSREVFAVWERLAAAGDAAALNRAVFEKVYSPEYRETYRAAFAMLEKTGTPEEMRRFGVLVAACAAFDAKSMLAKITHPTLVVGSERDEVVTAEASRAIAAALGCKLYLYDGYSHAVYDEAPDFRERMFAFLREE